MVTTRVSSLGEHATLARSTMRIPLVLFACGPLTFVACTREPPLPSALPAQSLGGTLGPSATAAPAPAPTPGDSDAKGHESLASPPGGHPRIWITPTDLPRLRAWATAANPTWQKGIVPARDEAIAIYEKEFYPGGKPNPVWPDPGGNNWVPRATEAYAAFFAFLSLVEPDPAARAAHTTRARNLLMYVMREAVKGEDSSQHPAPFRAHAFATYNRASAWGDGFGLTVDWIYPALTASDKALIRRVFMRWGDDNVHAATAGNEHPEPIGLLNDPRLLADQNQLRWTIDNYYSLHMRQLAFYGLALDPSDDPPMDPAAPPGKLGNTLRSYLDNAIGAWLYQQYAVYEDPAVAAPALKVPAEGLGIASGGLSPEGFLYGASIGSIHQALLGLYTAGYRDPRALGPQIQFINSRYWERFTEGILHSITPEPALVPAEPYLGPVYQVASYGDLQRFWLGPGYAGAFLSLAIHARATGNTALRDRARWIAMNAVEGTQERLHERIARVAGNSTMNLSILYFLALDPSDPPPKDPRPSLPLAFVDRPLGRVIARTAWGPNATMFDYKCSWETISHQLGDGNQFELYRNGEWLVKERSGYANDLTAYTSENHNTLGIQNKVTSGADKPKSLQWFEAASWDRGGQFTLGSNGGDPKVATSSGEGWVYAQGDTTVLYNRRSGNAGDEAMDVTHASRSIAWLMPDIVVAYDRATTRSDKRFKRFHLVTGGDPEASGKLATFTTPKGQKLYVHTLLPTGAALTTAKVEPMNQLASGEPSRSRLLVEDPQSPRDVRFLHVLEGADATAPKTVVRLVQSSAGTPFAGAAVGRSVAMFPVDLTAPFTRVSYTVPVGTTAHLVAGLRAGASYDVSLKSVGSAIEVTVTPGSAHHADAAGVIAIGSLANKH